MRRNEKAILDFKIIEKILTTSEVGRLGTISKDGFPRIKPVNFVYEKNAIYIHSAIQGEKIDDIILNSRVCFEIDIPIGYISAVTTACRASYAFRSVMILGRASILQADLEKKNIFTKLMEKHQPELDLGNSIPAKLENVAIIKIDILELTGKESLGKEPIRSKILQKMALNENFPQRFNPEK
jgi:nitroimidazol reductase NimA-like FMN-containing flavoprotein (pyridoxamine 5'-phosphate oxidase superfamily)